MDSCAAIQLRYFTKEFSGYEIESKWTLLNQSPVPTILGWMSDIALGLWSPYKIQKCMGRMPNGIRFFDVQFIFWGVYIDGIWREIAKAAKCPWHKDYYLLSFKSEEEFFMSNVPNFPHWPLKRRESRSGDWIDYQNMVNQVRLNSPGATIIGEIQRERCSIYITNANSYRNFCLSADKCRFQNSILSQVEIEYKGRNGIWFWHPNISEIEILNEFQELHTILQLKYCGLISSTTTKKFQWIVDCLEKTTN